ncbi:peptidase inhibitor family I36 protein [Streptomyces sp. NPDC050145]|uniref:peptidase inhibitor family I36 protein n=1 Tax=Streptomyces sp. NPDC050145 TaxID=3365602 RepID=UPI0037A5EA77
MKTTWIGLGAAALLVSGVGTATALDSGPQQADRAAWKKCPLGAVCLYTEPNGRGKVYKIWGKTNHNFKGIESIWNHGDRSQGPAYAKVKYNSNKWRCYGPGGYSARIRPAIEVDAVRWRTGC